MIISGNYENVNRIRLRSKSLDVNYDRICQPIRPNSMSVFNPFEANTAEIVFNDTYELDTLIDALNDFRQKLYRDMGIFKASGFWQEGMSRGEGILKGEDYADR